ncbi:MAG: hypothetical protein ABI833_11115 [Acidobacteriota bacterium]
MKTILTSVLVGSLLATLAVAEQPSRVVGRLGFADNAKRRAAQHSAPGAASPMVYAITIGFEFGAVDLRSGAFLPIGAGLPPDVGDGLVPGPGKSLLSLGFTGNLYSIDPFTGQTSLVGATGLGDCSTPTSPCGPNSALWIGYVDGHYYVTDFANNLYSLDPKTAATKLIGPTGIPGLTFPPFSENPDGSVNVFGASLFSFRGKFYAYFATLSVNFATGTFTPLIPGAIYRIDPATGHATMVAPTETTLSAIVNVNDTVYAFNGFTGQEVVLDVTNGHTTVVTDVDPEAGVIAGAAPARPAAPVVH